LLKVRAIENALDFQRKFLHWYKFLGPFFFPCCTQFNQKIE
jgi:hypothetical protein